MSQLGGDFVFGPGAPRVGLDFCYCLGLTNVLGPTCTFASRMQHTEDREWLDNDGLKLPDIFESDIEISELIQHLGIATCPSSPSRTLTALSGNERSQRNCSELPPDELVLVPSQLDNLRSTPP